MREVLQTSDVESMIGVSELTIAKNMMYRDTPLTPQMISSLMHIDVELSRAHLHEAGERRKDTSRVLYSLGVVFSSALIALIVSASFLYFYNIGPFYDPLEAASL